MELRFFLRILLCLIACVLGQDDKQIIWIPSPNFEKRSTPVDMLIIHQTEEQTFEDAIRILTDNKATHPVSAHYLIAKNGTIAQLVKDEDMAHHAGVSYWRGRESLNTYSIGIELDNTGEVPFTNELMDSLFFLVDKLNKKYNFDFKYIQGHIDIAPNRKQDPSYLFTWKRMFEKGYGYFPKQNGTDEVIYKPGDQSEGFRRVQNMLNAVGYNITVNGMFDEASIYVVRAFKSHYCSHSFKKGTEDIWDDDARVKLNDILATYFSYPINI